MIYFIRKWENDIENTWSGTPLKLYNSLNKYEKVQKIDVKFNKIQKLILVIVKCFSKIFNIDECMIVEHFIAKNIIDKQKYKEDEKNAFILFTDYPIKNIANSYIYIDCSVDYVLRTRKSDNNFKKFIPMNTNRKHSLLKYRSKNANVFYKKCKGIFTMGKWLEEDLIKNTNIESEKVHCVGGGCNIPVELIDDSQKEGNKILFVGKDFERKGGTIVLEAFEVLNRKFPNKYELYIAGPEVLNSRYKLSKNIHFVGRKTMKELSEYYNKCDIFVMPSYYEAYGIVFGEALIYGLPCIGRRAFSMKDFIEDGVNGYLIDEDNAVELAQMMYNLINDNKIRNNVKANREMYINQYSWDNVAKRMISVLNTDND